MYSGEGVRTLDGLAEVQSWVDDAAHGTILIDLHVSRCIVAPYIVGIIEKTPK